MLLIRYSLRYAGKVLRRGLNACYVAATMRFMSARTPSPAVAVTAGRGDRPAAFWDAVWHEPQPGGGTKPAKQRIGKAWLDFDGRDERGRPRWRKRRGRPAEGYFDERAAIAAAPQARERWLERQAAKAAVPTPAEEVTVRDLAREWLDWLQQVRSAAPSTVEDYGYMLREPGEPHKRGKGKSPGRLMKQFGDRRAIEVEPRQVSDWLRELDQSLTPRNVNKHRDLIHAIYAYGQRLDTYKLPENPVEPTDKRRQPPPARVDYYEVEEVEALARAAEQGAHRRPRGRANPNHHGPATPAPLSQRQRERQIQEQQLRAAEDRRDGDLFRILFYTGLRLGEIRALRVRDIAFAPDMTGAMLDVQNAFSAGQEKPPKSWKPREVPAPRPAAVALARVLQRDYFVGPHDYVFCNRRGQALSDSAIRKRYTAARKKAGLHPVTLHGLRHAAGSILAQRVDQVFASTTLGHQRVSTTDRYTHGKVNKRSIAVVNAAYDVDLDERAA